MMGSEGGFDYVAPKEGSAAMQLVNILPEEVDVVSCLQGLPASKLLDVRRSLNFDVPVFADSGSARKKAFELIRDIRNLRPLDGGPLRLAHIGEMMGILWRNLGALNNMKDPSFKFLE
jgi:predicted dinucleotide-binding enzyme